jgi:hypothetical protein
MPKLKTGWMLHLVDTIRDEIVETKGPFMSERSASSGAPSEWERRIGDLSHTKTHLQVKMLDPQGNVRATFAWVEARDTQVYVIGGEEFAEQITGRHMKWIRIETSMSEHMTELARTDLEKIAHAGGTHEAVEANPEEAEVR